MEFSINRRETVPNVITSLISSHVITPFTDILFLRCLCLGIINNRNWHKNYLRMLTLSVIKPNRISGYKLKLKKKTTTNLSKWYIQITRLSDHANYNKTS
jgi:hypothetical protein